LQFSLQIEKRNFLPKKVKTVFHFFVKKLLKKSCPAKI
jgi:hypothetical protein